MTISAVGRGWREAARGGVRGYSLRHCAIAISAALLTIEGVSSLGLALPVTGLGAVRETLDVAVALTLALLAAARIPAPPAVARLFGRLRPIALALAAVLLLAAALALVNAASLILFAAPPRYYVTDVIAFTDQCARLTLAGKNPYTSATGFAEALRRFPHVIPSPLRGPVFGSGADLPGRAVVAAVERRYLASPTATAGAFDPRTLASYPALSFLLYAPLVWLGLPSILLLDLLIFFALAGWLVWRVPGHERWWTALTLSAALPLLVISMIADTEVVSLAFILIAWRFRERRWLGAVALGLGCAFRQYCWFFAPFFLLDTLLRDAPALAAGPRAWLRSQGARDAGRKALTMLAAFLAPNLPYVFASPGAWWASVWLPLTAPLFPLGVGLVALATGHAIPSPPAWLYTALEVVALAGCLVAQWRWRARLGDAALLLALIPLYFAWRSLPNYFAIAPLLALFALGVRARVAGWRGGVGASEVAGG